ncbi:rhomboid family intramembrane serine protease [Luteolibacter yonseiensis]|uniref:Rhomboid family intramembrane serine protease n=1 Tax=Luteolibacter yonseiensis TaxID=1144680 RepID=A0A934R340_9BACT|nr:rhomboid family intramembrane serine protease [Luteolibacter yonseiensis]MBK1815416.1 rhomboid family intramembrane serine protease [Luteolibacter yonseiensis]
MGIADRDYQRNTSRRSGFFSQITPAVKWLLILNIGIFVLDAIIERTLGYRWLESYGAFTIQSGIQTGRVWEFITFQFLHGGFFHLLMNCLGIFFFGPWMERWWGTGKFVMFHLLCGVGGALFFALLAVTGVLPGDDLQAPLVGASAGIYGMLVGVAVISPDMRVRLLFPPVELSMRQVALGTLGISAAMILLRIGGNEGGEAGHLGGALAGYVLMRYPHLLGDRGIRIFQPKVTKPKPQPKIRPRSGLEKIRDTEVDLILDKISSHGFQSLTQEEKDLLQQASTQKQSKR